MNRSMTKRLTRYANITYQENLKRTGVFSVYNLTPVELFKSLLHSWNRKIEHTITHVTLKHFEKENNLSKIVTRFDGILRIPKPLTGPPIGRALKSGKKGDIIPIQLFPIITIGQRVKSFLKGLIK